MINWLLLLLEYSFNNNYVSKVGGVQHLSKIGAVAILFCCFDHIPLCFAESKCLEFSFFRNVIKFVENRKFFQNIL